MRTFYIFKINDEFATLTKNCPYNLFKSMEQIYYTKKSDISIAFSIFEQIVMPIDKIQTNLDIFINYKDSDHYTKFKDTHMINNFYSDEQTKMIVNNSYILLRSTKSAPSFLDNLKNIKNGFACDFENKDYFWLETIAS